MTKSVASKKKNKSKDSNSRSHQGKSQSSTTAKRDSGIAQSPHFTAKPALGIGGAVQTKVTIGSPNDRFEKEADVAARQVTTGQKAPAISMIPPGGLKATGQRQAEENSAVQEQSLQRQDEEPVQEFPLQKQDEEPVQETPIQRQDEEPVQDFPLQKQDEEPVQETALQRQDEEPVQEFPLQKQDEEPVQETALQRQDEEPVQEFPLQKQDEEPVQEATLQRQDEEPVQEFPLQKQDEEPVQEATLQRQDEEPVQELPLQKQDEEPVQEFPLQKQDEEPVQETTLQRQDEEPVQEFPLQKQDEEPVQEAALQRQDEEPVQELPLQKQDEEPVQEATLQRQDEEPVQEFPLQKQDEEPVQEATLQRQDEEPVQEFPLQKQDEEPVQEAAIQRQDEEPVQEFPLQKQDEEPVQEAALQRQDEEPVQEFPLQKQDEEPVQETPIQRQEDEEAVQSKKLSPFRSQQNDEELGEELKRHRGGGTPLNPEVRAPMEQQFDADFSGVRVHTGSDATQISKTLHAQAFTHGEDIYFNQGRYTPDNHQGRHLLAHELTHTIQQGASPSLNGRATPANAGASSVQGILFGGTLNKLVRHLPGWDLVTVIIGVNPLTDEVVERNPKNLLGAVVGLFPGGRALYDKLLEYGLVDRAFTWLMQKISLLNVSWSRVTEICENAWDEMGIKLGDMVAHNVGILKRHFTPLWNEIKAFAKTVVDKIIQLIKEAILTPLVKFIKKQTRAYPLLTVILGKDPITGKAVDRSLYNIVSAFLKLTESGEKYLQKLNESGQIEKLGVWLDTEINNLNLGPEVIIQTFTDAWNAIGIQDVLNPFKIFNKLWKIFAGPAIRLLRFVGKVAWKVLGLIKDWLITELKAHAHKIPGYGLLCVILEKDPITREPVPRTAKNFIRGFMSFVPGGMEKFNDLEKSGAIDRAMIWLTKEIQKLDLSWEMIVGLFREVWDSFTILDLVNPIGAFLKIIDIFKEPLVRIVRFAGAVALKVAEFIFIGVLGPTGARILKIFKKAKATFIKIINDPIGFASNLLAAVGKGFKQFVSNIGKHLKAGLIGWLMGALEGTDIQLPEKLDLKGIISIILQVLGITYARIRTKLVKHLGEGVVSKLEKVFEFIRILVTEGPAGIWKKILDYVGNLKDMVLGAIKNWVITKVITAAVMKIASMLNPVGAVIQAILSIYNTIMFFIERIQQIIALVEAIVDSIANIAAGKIDAAANYVEKTLARTIPVIISFLARLIGLGNVSGAIMKVIKLIRAKVDMAIDKVVGFIVKKVKKLFGKGKAALQKIKKLILPKLAFKSGEESHSIEAKKQGGKYIIVVKSDERKVDKFITETTTLVNRLEKKEELGPRQAKNIRKELDQLATTYKKWLAIETKDPNPKKQAKKEKNKEKKYKKIARRIMKIIHKLPKAKIKIPKCAKPDYTGKKIDNELVAWKAVINPLTHKEIPEGQSTGSEEIPGINTKGYEEQSAYKLHLIHTDLGGVAKKDTRNLVAGSKSTNEQMRSLVEFPTLEAVGVRKSEGGKRKKLNRVLSYRAEVTYDENADDTLKWVAKRIKVESKIIKGDKEGATIGHIDKENY